MARGGATVINQADGSGVGDIRDSMLTEAEFQAQNGAQWVLMDGRNVAGSKYATLKGVSTIPDGRGVILRAKNNGRSDGNQNPDGDSSLGTFQSHQVVGHQHETNASGPGGGPGIFGGGAGYGTIGGFVGFGGYQAALTNTTGGNETRMRNITVNRFIKIN